MTLSKEIPVGSPEQPHDSDGNSFAKFKDTVKRSIGNTRDKLSQMIAKTTSPKSEKAVDAHAEKQPEFTKGMVVKIDYISHGWRIQDKKQGGMYTVWRHNTATGEWETKDISEETLREHNLSTPEFITQGRQPFRAGQEVYVVMKPSGAIERGWHVMNTVDGKWMVTKTIVSTRNTTSLGSPLKPDLVAHIHEIEGSEAEMKTLPEGKEFEFYQRFRSKLTRNASLPSDHFKMLFNGELQQGSNLGNCYLIAAFTSLRASPYFEAIMRTSIRWSPEGYRVKFPLGGADPRKEILVTTQELQYQIVDPNQDMKGRARINPVQGSTGWKVLEMAYVKLKTGGSDRSKIEGGWGPAALKDMMSNGGVEKSILHSSHDKSLEECGKKNEVVTWLNQFHNGRSIATVSSMRQKTQAAHPNSRTYPVQVDGRTVQMYYNHAYAIQRVMRFCKPPTVVVKNPHDTSESMMFSFDEFVKAFSCIGSVDVDFNQLFPA